MKILCHGRAELFRVHSSGTMCNCNYKNWPDFQLWYWRSSSCHPPFYISQQAQCFQRHLCITHQVYVCMYQPQFLHMCHLLLLEQLHLLFVIPQASFLTLDGLKLLLQTTPHTLQLQALVPVQENAVMLRQANNILVGTWKCIMGGYHGEFNNYTLICKHRWSNSMKFHIL